MHFHSHVDNCTGNSDNRLAVSDNCSVSGSHSASDSCSADPGNRSDLSGSHSADPGNRSDLSGSHSADPGNRSDLSGSHSAGSGNPGACFVNIHYSIDYSVYNFGYIQQSAAVQKQCSWLEQKFPTFLYMYLPFLKA